MPFFTNFTIMSDHCNQSHSLPSSVAILHHISPPFLTTTDQFANISDFRSLCFTTIFYRNRLHNLLSSIVNLRHILSPFFATINHTICHHQWSSSTKFYHHLSPQSVGSTHIMSSSLNMHISLEIKQ